MPQQSTGQLERLDRVLQADDPARRAQPETEQIEDALDALGHAIVSNPLCVARHRPRRRLTAPRRAIAVAAVLASLAGVATAATTLLIPTHTHTYPSKWAITGGGPGEILNTRGTNFREIALALSADTPYPPGYAAWRDRVLTLTYEGQPWHQIPSGALRGSFATSAICAWVIGWRHATLTGNRALAARDAAVLTGALHWSAVRAWDPDPSVSVPGDMGSTHPSTFGWAIPYIAAVRDGDLAKLDQALGNDRFWGNFGLFDPGYFPWVKSTHARLGPRSYLSYLAAKGRP